jgi:hypothetical protein
MEAHFHSEKRDPRALKESELEAQRYKQIALRAELDHFVQTHQDTASVVQRLEDIDATIKRLEHEIGEL